MVAVGGGWRLEIGDWRLEIGGWSVGVLEGWRVGDWRLEIAPKVVIIVSVNCFEQRLQQIKK